MNEFVIGLGSNIDPEENIAKARDLLKEKFDMRAESEFVRTKPIGYTEQADFINGAVLLQSNKNSDAMREELKCLEKSLGREVSPIKSGPRTIDLDIVVFNREIVDQDFYDRDFLKTSVLELLPDLVY